MGKYHTLAGIGIIIDLLAQSIKPLNIDPSTVVLRFKDGHMGARLDVMYPTPHTVLFENVSIANDKLSLNVGRLSWDESNSHQLPLADPNLVDNITNLIKLRAKSHSKTRKAIGDLDTQK